MLTIDDAYCLLGAIVRCALADVRSGTTSQKEDAAQFLDVVAPDWELWPPIHRQRAVIVSAKRLATTTQKNARNRPKFNASEPQRRIRP